MKIDVVIPGGYKNSAAILRIGNAAQIVTYGPHVLAVRTARGTFRPRYYQFNSGSEKMATARAIKALGINNGLDKITTPEEMEQEFARAIGYALTQHFERQLLPGGAA
jgi:hypothetical protein